MVKGAVKKNASPTRTINGVQICDSLEMLNARGSREDRWRALLSVVPNIEEMAASGVGDTPKGLPPCSSILDESGQTEGARSDQKPRKRSADSKSKIEPTIKQEAWYEIQHNKAISKDGSTSVNIKASTSSTAKNAEAVPNSKYSKKLKIEEAVAGPSSEYSGEPGSVLSNVKKKLSSFECTLCGSSFAEKYNLNKHVRTVHEKKRPFNCHICPVTFKQKDHLKKHVMTVHERKRPFICDLCGATFGWVSVLNKHVRSVHEKKRPFECSECHYSFQQESHLLKHIATAHSTAKLQRDT